MKNNMYRYYRKDENGNFVESTQSFAIRWTITIVSLAMALYSLTNVIKYKEQVRVLESQNVQLCKYLNILQSSEAIPFNVRNVEKYIDYFPFKDPKTIKMQMRIESANTLSELARKYNNLFGMRNAKSRFQFGKYSEDWRYYPHWTLSVVDMFERERNGGTLKNYAEDSNYLQKLK